MEEVNLGCGAACASYIWEDKIQEAAVAHELEHGAKAVLFTDSSRGEDGRVAGGWAKDYSRLGPGVG